MTTTLQEVRDQTKARREASSKKRNDRLKTGPQRWSYTYLSKSDKSVIDQVDCNAMTTLLEHDLYETFAWILGVLIDLKIKGGKLNADQEKVLKYPLYLFKAVRGE